LSTSNPDPKKTAKAIGHEVLRWTEQFRLMGAGHLKIRRLLDKKVEKKEGNGGGDRVATDLRAQKAN